MSVSQLSTHAYQTRRETEICEQQRIIIISRCRNSPSSIARCEQLNRFLFILFFFFLFFLRTTFLKKKRESRAARWPCLVCTYIVLVCCRVCCCTCTQHQRNCCCYCPLMNETVKWRPVAFTYDATIEQSGPIIMRNAHVQYRYLAKNGEVFRFIL